MVGRPLAWVSRPTSSRGDLPWALSIPVAMIERRLNKPRNRFSSPDYLPTPRCFLLLDTFRPLWGPPMSTPISENWGKGTFSRRAWWLRQNSAVGTPKSWYHHLSNRVVLTEYQLEFAHPSFWTSCSCLLSILNWFSLLPCIRLSQSRLREICTSLIRHSNFLYNIYTYPVHKDF